MRDTRFIWAQYCITFVEHCEFSDLLVINSYRNISYYYYSIVQ